ncbi:Uncharacterized protein APZ42_033150 [Daphnia magna]|uniref:Uncharacterized protein n=1 Tax=Daphnia magna TaxID=35525 RepID=A0A164LEQ3_9CRUS|nr:Uncharacterized protein APZ42_033150 [Daphnia magna]
MVKMSPGSTSLRTHVKMRMVAMTLSDRTGPLRVIVCGLLLRPHAARYKN